MSKYWVVEASWGKTECNHDRVLSRGYWYITCTKEEMIKFTNQKEPIQIGDKIAVRDKNATSSMIKIKAIGVVKEINLETNTIGIEWLLEEVKRNNVGQGCIESLTGPFFEKEDWVNTLLDSL